MRLFVSGVLPVATRLQRRFVSDVNEAMKVFGMDQGVPFPRGRTGVEAHAALVGANRESLAKRYKELARVYHPDSPSGDVEEMKRVNLAYKILVEELPSRPSAIHKEEAAEEGSYQKSEDPEKAYQARKRAGMHPEQAQRRREQQRSTGGGSFVRQPSKASMTFDEVDEATQSSKHVAEQMNRFFSKLHARADYDDARGLNKRKSTPPKTPMTVAAEQLRKENNGMIRKKSSSPAQKGKWL
ncbi:hypothetical protein DIPPA_27878 [Diplonema papillatum]|nr:hypothetical protein DIPPA_27878 [Diplonema papillatum]|eukprot:gene20276-31194_t